MSNLSRERLRVKEGTRVRAGKAPDMQPTGWGTARHTAAYPNILDFSVFRAIVETEEKAFPITSLRRHHLWK